MKKLLLIYLIFLLIGFSMTQIPVYCAGKYISELTKDHSSSIVALDSAEEAIHFYKDSFTIDAVNSSQGIQFYKDGIIFIMNTKNNYNGLADYISFGRYDTYYAPLKSYQLKQYDYFCNNFPFPYSPGALSFTGDYHTMYFTKSELNEKNERKSQIYQTVETNSTGKKNTGWSKELEVLTFCKKEYSYMHPAVSLNGQILIFSSDMPSKNNGANLFVVTHNSSGWTNPNNLGNKINSDGNEIFPFLDIYNNLFFSSNKENGYGGYDIYMSKYNGEDWDVPVNLGSEINSGYDEMMFKLSRDDTLAVLVSIHDPENVQTHFFKVNIPARIKAVKKPTSKTVVETPLKPENPDTSVIINKKVAKVPAKQQEENIPPREKIIPSKEKVSPVVFRIQFLSSTKPKGNFIVTINNKEYTAFEYFYKGAYRYTVGEFDSIKKALVFNTLCRKAGYKQAFVAAFKNDLRITDPKVFRH